MVARRLFIASLLVSFGCGGGSAIEGIEMGPNTSVGPCKDAVVLLERKLGPEMGQVVNRLPLKDPAGGQYKSCLVAYTMVPEEFAEDGVESDSAPGQDQLIGIVTTGNDSQTHLTTIGPSSSANGPVLLTIKTQDVTGDDHLDYVIEEDGTTPGETYRGLRVFVAKPGMDGPVESFSSKLEIKTPEGLAMIAEWKPGKLDGQPVLVLEGAGVQQIWAFNPGDLKFAYDDAATKRIAEKKKAAEAPPPAAATPPTDTAPPAADAPAPPATDAPLTDPLGPTGDDPTALPL